MKRITSAYRHLRFEHHRQELLPRHLFLRRLTVTICLCIGILTVWIVAGMIGYHALANLSWLDSFLNAAMIVGGMGPVDMLRTSSAKIFAGIYAILSGVVFLVVFGLLIAPVFHRFLHRFHLEAEDDAKTLEITSKNKK